MYTSISEASSVEVTVCTVPQPSTVTSGDPAVSSFGEELVWKGSKVNLVGRVRVNPPGAQRQNRHCNDGGNGEGGAAQREEKNKGR